MEIPWPKITWSKIVGGPLWNGGKKKNKNGGEYTGSTPAFCATHHAAQREVLVCTHSRVWINRTGKINISLSSFAPENLVSRDRFVQGTRYHIWYQCIIFFLRKIRTRPPIDLLSIPHSGLKCQKVKVGS